MAEHLRFWDDATNTWKLRAGLQASSGAADAGKAVSLNADGQIDDTMLPTSSLLELTASEAISAGDAVNKWDNGGTVNVRLADASNNRPCHGFATEAIASAATGKIDSDGSIAQAGLTIGSKYFLGTTPGAITADPDETTGNLLQVVGTASDATVLSIELGEFSEFVA